MPQFFNMQSLIVALLDLSSKAFLYIAAERNADRLHNSQYRELNCSRLNAIVLFVAVLHSNKLSLVNPIPDALSASHPLSIDSNRKRLCESKSNHSLPTLNGKLSSSTFRALITPFPAGNPSGSCLDRIKIHPQYLSDSNV